MGPAIATSIFLTLAACGGAQKREPIPSRLAPVFGQLEVGHVEKREDISLQIAVRDRHHTNPLLVAVMLTGRGFEKQELTEPDGTFAFRSLAPGDYDLRLFLLEATVSQKLLVGSEVTTQVSVDLDYVVVH